MWLGQPVVRMLTRREQSWEKVKAGRIPETSVWSPVLSSQVSKQSVSQGEKAAVS